jgi:citrate lyase subunit beta/citryl-CoA lyase
MSAPVTYLFVPGNRPERFEKALASGADAIVLDLEDAVEPALKDEARAAVRRWLGTRPVGVPKLVRINDASTSWFAGDLAVLSDPAIDGVVLPKTEDSAQVATVADAIGPEAVVIPLIESARGLQAVNAIASSPRVQRLAFGSLDFGADLNLSGDERGLTAPALTLSIASRCAGIAAPIAGVTARIDDDEALALDTAWARAIGFTAKLCIHPRQIAPVRRGMGPTDAEREWARRVIKATERSSGAVKVDGQMVDRPVILKAQSILERASQSPSN